MTQLENLEKEIQTEKAKLKALTRGCVTMPSGAPKIIDRITRLCQKRQSLIDNQTHSLAENLPDNEDERNKVYRLMVKLPIVADFLYACCVELHDLLKRYNMEEITISTKVRAIRDHAKDMAFLLSNFEQLEQILSNDDTLIEALDKKVNSFLNQNMKIV